MGMALRCILCRPSRAQENQPMIPRAYARGYFLPRLRRSTRASFSDDYSESSAGRILITTDFDAGVLLLSAKLRKGTSTLVSGK